MATDYWQDIAAVPGVTVTEQRIGHLRSEITVERDGSAVYRLKTAGPMREGGLWSDPELLHEDAAAFREIEIAAGYDPD